MKTIERKRMIGEVIALGVLLVALVIVAGHGSATEFFSSSIVELSSSPGGVATPPPATSTSNQQNIDTNLSLLPSSATPAPIAVSNGCDLNLNFSITSGNISSAGTMGYILAAKNVGNTTCQSASISVYYGDNESFVSASPKATADGYYWAIGNLAAGQEYDISLTTNRTASASAGASTDEACLSANNGADACANAGAASAPAASTPTQTQTIPSQAQVASIATTVSSYTPPSNKEFGVWVWTPLTQMTPTEMQNVVDEAAQNNFNAIYLTVDDYLTLVALPDGIAKQQQLAAYDQDITTFLSLAQAKGIVVDAESGSSDWAEPANLTNAYRIMVFVASYNASHTTKFRGVQYDIEPYLLPEYNTDMSAVLTPYVELVQGLASLAMDDKLPLTIIVPHFYDANENWTPEVTVDGVTNYTYRQILRFLNTVPQSRIIIMAYRNFATGSDGSIDLSQSEIQEADATNVKVLVAQETGPVTPAYVTFNSMTRSELFGQVALINQAFANDTSFGGIAIDYLDPFLKLQ